MFVTVRFGNDQRQIFNPDCAVVNLLTDIKRRCFVGMSQDIDLTDETGNVLLIDFPDCFKRVSFGIQIQT